MDGIGIDSIEQTQVPAKIIAQRKKRSQQRAAKAGFVFVGLKSLLHS